MVERDEKVMKCLERVLIALEKSEEGMESLAYLSNGTIKSKKQAIQYVKEGTPAGNALYNFVKTIYGDGGIIS
jgi:hypothetical protein